MGPSLHVFGDILDRRFDSDRQELEGIMTETLSLWADHQREHKSGGITTADLNVHHQELSSNLYEILIEKLEHIEFKEHCRCLRHVDREGGCPVTPRLDRRFRESWWMEGAGSICVPFTGMVANHEWLHPATLIFLVWCFSKRFYESAS